MPAHPRDLSTLDWPALVAEALRRRKEEGLTQREHAALADVSVPTIGAFDRGELTLSLNKAFAILRVVGLLAERGPAYGQDVFVNEAMDRWRALTAGLPAKAPGRFPHGWYRIDYALTGPLRLDLRSLPKLLGEAEECLTGWPPFWVPTKRGLVPREIDGVLECWLGSELLTRNEPAMNDADHLDFWRADPAGRLFLLRGYQEDAQETFSPGAIFDLTLPTWRLGEALLHAKRFGVLASAEPDRATARFRVTYTGLKGRVLRAWANPLVDDTPFAGHRAISDEAVLEVEVPIAVIEADLDRIVLGLVQSLFTTFDAEIPASLVARELSDLRGRTVAG